MRAKALTNSVAARAAISVALAGALLGGTKQAGAEEIQILSAASMQTVLNEVIGAFERTSGHKLVIRYSTMGAITERVMGGEVADLIISSPTSISTLAARGKINVGSEIAIASTGVGIVVASGEPKPLPRVESVEDFKRALLAAKVIVYANPAGGGAAGIHIARVIDKLGLAERLKPKFRFGAGGDVTEVTLARGEGALGLTQVSEIVGKAGAALISLPDELQNYTGFVAGTPTGAHPSEAVGTLIKFLKTPAVLAVLKAKGMQVE
jgi:molybdate transport system substrate-binding protein